MTKNANQKILTSDNRIANDTILMTWALPYEFWLLSTIETGKTYSFVAGSAANDLLWASGISNAFITNWGLYSYKELPQRYFNFTDTTSAYTVK